MRLELGPVPAGDVATWCRLARRLSCELRVHPGELEGIATQDLLDGWSQLIEAWDAAANSCLAKQDGGSAKQNSTEDPSQDTPPCNFRWSENVDTELAEYLLHGLDRIIQSSAIKDQLTKSEIHAHGSFTLAIVQAFVDGLSGEGRCHQHFVDQVRADFGARLDH